MALVRTHTLLAVLLAMAMAWWCCVPLALADDAASGAAEAAAAPDASDTAIAPDAPETVPLLVIVVGFDGGDAGSDAATPYDEDYDWSSTIFESEDSLSAYYLDMSLGAFTYAPARETCAFGMAGNTNVSDREDDGVVHVTLHREHGAWGLVNEKSTIADEFGNVVREALAQASAFVDLASYDANGDGILTHDELAACICVAGYDASPFDNPDRRDIPVIWPHSGKLATNSEEALSTGVYQLDSYIAMAEYLTFDKDEPSDVIQEPLGILYHELGHYQGLIDLYAQNDDYESGTWGAYRVGDLSLMDSGSWTEADLGGDGTLYLPTAFDAWCRYVLGWSMPTVVVESGDYTVSSQLSDAGYSTLLIPTRDPSQYYLVENRQPEGHDLSLSSEYAEGNPRGGIVIWHVSKEMYLRYGFENKANDTNHAPAVMELFFEEYNGLYTTDWPNGTPVSDEPFYDAASFTENYGHDSYVLDLPLYEGEDGGSPSSRGMSGIRLRFPTESARDMTVHVELDSTACGAASKAYPLDDETLRNLRCGSGELASIACAALRAETEADVSVVDAGSITGGLPEGTLSYADVYGVLPTDADITCYRLTGEQLVELAEEAVEAAKTYHDLLAAREALLAFDFIDEVPDLGVSAPDPGAALAFGGMKFEVDWYGPAGARARYISIADRPVNLEEEYYVAMTPEVAKRYGLFADLNRNTTMLWGTPADALRSFVQTDNWEQIAGVRED